MRIPNENPFPGIVPPIGERNKTPSLTSAHVSDPKFRVSERDPLTTAHNAPLRHGEKDDKFPLMTASVTDLRRRTSEIVDRVKSGESVEIEIHGKPVATMEPSSDGIDAGVLLDALLRLDPDPDTADEIQSHVDAIRKAGR